MKLSELKASPDVGLAEYRVDVCVSAKLASELEAADRVLFDAEQAAESARGELEAARHADEDAPAPRPRRVGESANADLARVVAETEEAAAAAAVASDAIRERMAEHTVSVLLRGKGSGEWRLWADKHPAREEDDHPAGWERDRRHAGGFCDIDALVADLHQWIAAYGEESPSDEWWEFLSTSGAPAHLTQAASRVVQMHEQVVDLGKSRAAWRAERKNGTASK